MRDTRRAFVIRSALALAGATLGKAAAPGLNFPTSLRERLAVASYSFRSLIDTPKNRTRVQKSELIPLNDFPAAIAKRYRIHCVELLGPHFPGREPAYLKELRDAVSAAKSRIVNIPASLGASLYDPDASRRTMAVENARGWVDTAVAVGCPGLRVQLKDEEVEAGRTVRVDLPRTFAIATESAFKGFYSIEWEGAGDVWSESGRLIEQSLRHLA